MVGEIGHAREPRRQPAAEQLECRGAVIGVADER